MNTEQVAQNIASQMKAGVMPSNMLRILRLAEEYLELRKAAINMLEFGQVCDCEDTREKTCVWCDAATTLNDAIK